MKLTKKEKQLCVDKWQWFYDHPGKATWENPIRLSKYKQRCILCHKLTPNWGRPHCFKCPVVIKSGESCWNENPNSFYYRWYRATTSKTRKKYAGKLLEIMKSLEVEE